MILFPLVLIAILGAAFAGAFSNNIELNDVHVLYTIQGDQELATGFQTFLDELKQEMGITFEKTTQAKEGIASIKDVKYSCYILLTENPQEIKIYKNERYHFEANLLESLVSSFAGRYSTLAQIAQVNPSVLGKILADPAMDFVQPEPLDRKRQPGSLDYYAVTMLTLFMMYASLTGLWSIKNEQNFKTGNRMLCSPVTKPEILVGKAIGGLLVTIVQAGIVILFSKYFLKAYWGPDIAPILLILLTEAIMAICLGTGIAYLVRNDSAAAGLLNTIIPIFVFLGGGYVSLSMLTGTLAKMTALSPVKWTNDAIFRVIYDGDYSHVLPAILINLAIAAVFVAISALLSRKEAV